MGVDSISGWESQIPKNVVRVQNLEGRRKEWDDMSIGGVDDTVDSKTELTCTTRCISNNKEVDHVPLDPRVPVLMGTTNEVTRR